MLISQILKTRKNIFLIVLALALYACINTDEYDLKKVTASPSYVLPIGYGEISLKNLLSDVDAENLKEENDGSLYLIYEQTINSQDIRNLLKFPDRNFNQGPILPPGTFPPNNTEITFATYNATLDFSFNPENLSKILLKQGLVSINTSTVPNFNYEVLIEFPDLTKNNTPLSQRIVGGTASTIDLTGYTLKFNDDKIPAKFTIIKKPSASSVVIDNNTKVNVDLSFTNIDFRFVEGFLGDQQAELPEESIAIDAFNPIDGANFSFAEPELSFEVSNQYGIPVGVNFESLEARKPGSSPLIIEMNKPNPIAVASPAVVGQTVKTEVNVINAKDLLDFKPEEIHYKVSARINEQLLTGINFCHDTSKLKVKFRAKVPLYGHASNIKLSDTLDVAFDDIENSKVESVAIKAKISNEFPLGATLQLYLADDKFVITDSLFKPNQTIIEASKVNAQGDLLTKGEFNDEIEVAKEKMEKLLKAKKLIAVARMSTTKNADGTQPNVKFKSAYKMNMNFGLRVDLKIDADL